MGENVPATGTSWLLTFFFSVTQCNLFISVSHVSLSGNSVKGKKGNKEHSMGPGKYSCHRARTEARLSVSGECQTAKK